MGGCDYKNELLISFCAGNKKRKKYQINWSLEYRTGFAIPWSVIVCSEVARLTTNIKLKPLVRLQKPITLIPLSHAFVCVNFRRIMLFFFLNLAGKKIYHILYWGIKKLALCKFYEAPEYHVLFTKLSGFIFNSKVSLGGNIYFYHIF